MAIRLICPDTIEQKIMLLQENKKELIDDLIKVDANALKSLSKEDILQLLD
jgi:SNF2 family DNA or RNA helicase